MISLIIDRGLKTKNNRIGFENTFPSVLLPLCICILYGGKNRKISFGVLFAINFMTYPIIFNCPVEAQRFSIPVEQKSPQSRKLFVGIFLLPCCFLSSCASPYRELPSGGYDENPPSDAIVGLWKKTELRPNRVIYDTVMFKPDGTGFETTLFADHSGEVEDNPLILEISWKYDGNGRWTKTSMRGSSFAHVSKVPSGGGSRTLHPEWIHEDGTVFNSTYTRIE